MCLELPFTWDKALSCEKKLNKWSLVEVTDHHQGSRRAMRGLHAAAHPCLPVYMLAHGSLGMVLPATTQCSHSQFC